MDPQEYDALLRQLVRIQAHQDTMTEDLRALIRQQVVINQQLTITKARVETTLAHIETLLARMRERHEDNGREA